MRTKSKAKREKDRTGEKALADDAEQQVVEALDLSADERKLITQPYDYSVDQLVAHVDKGKVLLMEVPYQREYVWDDTKASRLIESLLLNVPIPVCYFSENEDNTWEAIDGLQRVNSIVRYLKGEFFLRGLTVLVELNGKSFEELAARDQRRIESRTLRVVVITQESHPDIKFDIFERLNTGSVQLHPQELRNCIYRGAFNDSLHEIAENEAYRNALGRERDARMRDEELALRFFALYTGVTGYKPPLTQFLNEFMRLHRKEKPPETLLRVFQSTMKAIATVFEGTAFYGIRDGEATSNLNRALFDAVSISVAFCDRKQFVKYKPAVIKAHNDLVQNSNFMPLIGRATADRARMMGRIRMYTNMLNSLGVRTKLPELPTA